MHADIRHYFNCVDAIRSFAFVEKSSIHRHWSLKCSLIESIEGIQCKEFSDIYVKFDWMTSKVQ